MDEKGLFLLCEQLANLLGFKLDKRDNENYRVKIIINEKAAIVFRLDWRKNKKVFARCCTNSKYHSASLGDEIGFSYDRNPIAIAGDIKRRLLKNLDSHLDKYLSDKESRAKRLQILKFKSDSFLTAHSFLEKSHDFNLSYGRIKYNLKRPIKTDKVYNSTNVTFSLDSESDYMDLKFGRLPDVLAYKIIDCFRKHFYSIHPTNKTIH